MENEQNSSNKSEGKTPEPEEKDSYFTKTKAERQKARDEATETIKEILENVQSSQETKNEAIKQATKIAQRIEDEANIEALVRAKGFKECLAFTKDDECTIAVSGQALSEVLATQIKDIACSYGRISVDKVKILEIN